MSGDKHHVLLQLFKRCSPSKAENLKGSIQDVLANHPSVLHTKSAKSAIVTSDSLEDLMVMNTPCNHLVKQVKPFSKPMHESHLVGMQEQVQYQLIAT
jgi:hypothetical protein